MASLKNRLRAISGASAPKEKPPESACFHHVEHFDIETPDCPPGIFGPLFSVDISSLERAVYVDTETTGLSGGAGTLAFLIGLGRFEGGRLAVHQLLMRNYAQETDMLMAFARLMEGATALVSFNGKSFDIPLLRSRFIMHRQNWLWDDLPHVDLLHAARRVWKERIKGLKLVQIEEKLLDRAREGDVPGAEIPQIFFNFVKDQLWEPMRPVLRHNALDIATLPVLAGKIGEAAKFPEHPLDAYSIGRAHARGGDHPGSIRYFRIADVGALRAKCAFSLSNAYRRMGDIPQYVALNQNMARRGIGGALPLEALAKHYEHAEKDIGKALAATDAALLKADDEEIVRRLLHRRKRLSRKKGKCPLIEE